jgi:Domain of unknown function (DUF6265)
MRKIFFFVNVLLIILISCKPKENTKVEIFNWLNGQWTMNTVEGMVTEEWKTNNDSLMVGKSDLVKGDTVIPFETIRMFRRGIDFFYEAKAAGQNNEQPVEFKLSFFSDSGFVAENPQHDFPKRITYKLINKDSIHAFVDGGPQMPEKKSDFFYSRKKE